MAAKNANINKANLFSKISDFPSDFWCQPVFKNSSGELQCPGCTGETYATNPWDYLVIGGSLTPGLAEVSPKKFRDLDKKKQKSTDGARLTVHGIEPALVEIKLTLWTPEQWEVLKQTWKILFPPPQKVVTTKKVPDPTRPGPPHTQTEVIGINHDTGTAITRTTTIPTFLNKTVSTSSTKAGKAVPFDVRHPALELLGINSLVFLSGDGPMPGSYSRSRVFLIRAIEFLQPGKVNAGSTPDSSNASPQTTKFSKADYPPPGDANASKGG